MLLFANDKASLVLLHSSPILVGNTARQCPLAQPPSGTISLPQPCPHPLHALGRNNRRFGEALVSLLVPKPRCYLRHHQLGLGFGHLQRLIHSARRSVQHHAQLLQRELVSAANRESSAWSATS
jgi:hypothetical protein